jgi:ABC-2 type transport system ATP-binding protein
VAIIDRGRVIALGAPRDLIRSLGAEHVLEFALEQGDGPAEEVLRALPGVDHVHQVDGKTRLTVRGVHVAVPALMRALTERGSALSELTTHHATLEDVFLSLTGRHLRDE